MEIDEIAGQIAPVNVCKSILKSMNEHTDMPSIQERSGNDIPAGYYTPKDLRKLKRIQRACQKKEAEIRLMSQKPKGPILKSPIQHNPKQTAANYAEDPTKVTLQSILGKSS